MPLYLPCSVLVLSEVFRRLEAADSSIGAFQDDTVRQLVSSIRVLDRERLSIRFKDGTEVEQVVECVGRASA